MKRRTKKGRKQADRGNASQTRKQGPLHECEKKIFIVRMGCPKGVVNRHTYLLDDPKKHKSEM